LYLISYVIVFPVKRTKNQPDDNHVIQIYSNSGHNVGQVAKRLIYTFVELKTKKEDP